MSLSTTSARGLSRAVAALKAHGVVPAIAAPLRQDAAAITDTLVKRVTEEIDAFSSGGNPQILADLGKHLEDLVGGVCRLLEDRGVADLGFVSSYAQRCAQQRFPLEASLHAYRCSHRVLSSWIRDTALKVADPDAQVHRVVAAAAYFAVEYTDAVSTLATSQYVAHTRLMAEAEGDRRTELLNMLLSGYDEADGRIRELLRRAGYLEQRQSFCVAVARSVDPREMESAARAQRMVEHLSRVLRDGAVRALTGVRDGIVTVVMSGTRRLSGWTEPQASLAERVYPHLLQVGPAALIGLSSDAPSTAQVRGALEEAQMALDFASVADRVVAYSQIPFRQIVVRHARHHVQSALPAWFGALQRTDRKARGSLSQTLRAYANANMNALKAAEVLAVHPNTIYARMQRITDVTGKKALNYHDLTELLLALDSAAGEGAPPAG